MPIAIICTGNELLKGCCCNTNMQLLGEKLNAISTPPIMEITAGDNDADLFKAISYALKSADVLIISGGLGPTRDDITLHTVCRFFGIELAEIPELKEKVKKLWESRHSGRCPDFVYKQALVPKNGKFFPNPVGVASGIAFSTVYDSKIRHIYLLPGPPAEFETVLDNGIIDEIKSISGNKIHTMGFFICGAGEVSVAKTVEPLLAEMPVETAYTAVPGGTKLFVSCENKNTTEEAVKKAHNAFGINALDIGCFNTAEAVIKKLISYQMTLGCAESCTGGMAADSIVSLPGASAVFRGGIVSYANELKVNLLHVPENIITSFGAVSPQCAQAMAEGACETMQTDCAVATTGIAGPDGGTPEKPVGLVFIAASVRKLTLVKELHLHGSRKQIRERAAAAAIQLLWEMLNSPEMNIC